MPPDVLHQIDAAVDGRCVGPGCGIPLTADSPSAWWCSPECQAAWHRQGTDRPEQVRGLRAVGPDLARWRPDRVDTFDGRDLTLVSDQMVSPGGPTRRAYVHRDGRMFLRLDDGFRFVGTFLGQDEYATAAGRGELGEVWRRLEREMTDPRRLDPDRLAIARYGSELFDRWLADTYGSLAGRERDSAPPVAREESAQRVWTIVDDPAQAEVVTVDPGNPMAGALLWMADPPADPEAPTMAELEGGVDLTPYLVSHRDAFRRAGERLLREGGPIAGVIAAYQNLPEATRAAIEAEQDRVTLRALCSDNAEYERALTAARDNGLTVREVAEMLAAGQAIGQDSIPASAVDNLVETAD